jgi:hypothetical protein
MRRVPALALLAWLPASTGSCRIFSPLPDMRTALDHAREIEPRCKGLPGPPLLETLPPTAIDSVEPAYSYVQSGPVSPEARLRGARIRVRPLPGLSREALTRSLECHEVEVTLGGAPPDQDDPFVSAGLWLDVDVDSERDGFSVFIRTDEFTDAQQVVERARRYAAKRPAARGNLLPAASSGAAPAPTPAAPPSSPGDAGADAAAE